MVQAGSNSRLPRSGEQSPALASLARGARSTRSATPGDVEWRIGRFGGRALARATLSENGRRLAVQERLRRPIREPLSPSLSFQDSFRRLPEYLSQLLHPPPLLYGQTRSWPIAFLPGDRLSSLTGAWRPASSGCGPGVARGRSRGFPPQLAIEAEFRANVVFANPYPSLYSPACRHFRTEPSPPSALASWPSRSLPASSEGKSWDPAKLSAASPG